MAFGRNELTIGGDTMLLVDGTRTHLVRRCTGQAQGLPALDDWWFEQPRPWQDEYDIAALREPLWCDRTVCGREWTVMAAGEGPVFESWSEHVLVPECRSCLRIASKALASTDPDARIALVASLAVDEVVRAGSAQLVGVPGDQVEALRAGLRAELRRRGFRGTTHLVGDSVHVVSDDAWQQIGAAERHEADRLVLEALDHLATTGEPPPRLSSPGWVIDWTRWSVA